MQTQKMSLANIKGKLSRAEMKNIMAGSGTSCTQDSDCPGKYIDCGGSRYWAGGHCAGGTCSNSVVC